MGLELSNSSKGKCQPVLTGSPRQALIHSTFITKYIARRRNPITRAAMKPVRPFRSTTQSRDDLLSPKMDSQLIPA